MTNFTLENYIPRQDIKVRPKLLVEKICNLFDTEIEGMSFDDESSKKNIKVINYLYKKVKELLVNYYFWYNVSSYNFCCYQYSYTKDNKNEDIGRICGRRINKKNSYDNNSNMYLCAEHDRNHRKNHSKPIKTQEKENICNHINKDGSHCKYGSKINGLCTKHHKYKYKIDIEKVYNKIEFYKNYTNIDEEIKLLYNIENDKFLLSEQNLKNKKKNIGYENVRFLNKNIKSVNTSAYDKNEGKNISNLGEVTYCTITNSKNNIYNRLKKLNEKILFNTDIINNLKDNYDNNYIKIEYRKCEYKNCINCKSYNIIYNSYCTDHIHNKTTIPLPNFFYTHNNTIIHYYS